MSFSSDPWELLGLERQSSGEREVKRAYARLLKQHRPDQDPAGFQQLSGAYQRALQDLRENAERRPDDSADEKGGAEAESPAAGAAGRQETFDLPLEPGETAVEETRGAEAESGKIPGPGEETPPGYSDTGAHSAPAASSGQGSRHLEDFTDLPENFRPLCEQLRQRLQRPALSTAMPEFTKLRDMVREKPALAAPWVVVLDALFCTERGLKLLPQLEVRDVLLLMRQGEGACAARILLTWRDEPVLLNNLTLLGDLMLRQGLGNDPAMLRPMHFTAQVAAFHLPEISGRLADELYRQTGPGLREQMVREIEMRSAAGKLFAEFPLAQKRIWEHQLFESGEAGAEWSSPEKLAALQSLIAECDEDWEGWPLVSGVVPEPVMTTTLAQVREAQAAIQSRHWKNAIPRSPQALVYYITTHWRRFVPSYGRAFFLIWLAGIIANALVRPDPHSRPSTSLPPVPPSISQRGPQLEERKVKPLVESPSEASSRELLEKLSSGKTSTTPPVPEDGAVEP